MSSDDHPPAALTAALGPAFDPADAIPLDQPLSGKFRAVDGRGRQRLLRGQFLVDHLERVERAARDHDPLTAAVAAWLLIGKPATRDAHVVDLERWTNWLAERHLSVIDATGDDVHAWYRRLLDGNVATANRRVASISSLYRHLRKRGLVDANPVEELERRDRPRRREMVLTLDQMRALTSAAAARSSRDGLLIELLLFGGLRVSAVCTADVSDLAVTSGSRILTVDEKGGKSITVPLTDVGAHLCDRWLDDRARLLSEATAQARNHDTTTVIRESRRRMADADAGRLSPTTEPGVRPCDRWDDAAKALLLCDSGWRLTRQTARAYVEAIGRDAGIDGLYPHALRATLATRAAEAGVPIHHVQQALGHAHLGTTQVYLQAAARLDQHPAKILAGLMGR